MKKIMAILCSAALALSLCSVSFADKNLALDATATADSTGTAAGEAEQTLINMLNDGDMETRWQSNSKGTNADTAAWFQLDFDGAVNVNSLTMYWEAARPAQSGIKFEVSTDGTNFTAVDGEFATRDESGKNANDKTLYKDVFTLTDAAENVKAIKVTVTAMDASKEQPSIWEFEVYGSAVQGEGADTGVESVMVWAVVAMAAAAVVFVTKKVNA